MRTQGVKSSMDRHMLSNLHNTHVNEDCTDQYSRFVTHEVVETREAEPAVCKLESS